MPDLSSLPCPASRAALRRAHFDALHPKGSTGRAFVGGKVACDDGADPFEGIVADLGECTMHLGSEDEFVSLNRFWGRRRTGENIKAVGNVALDFDHFHEGLPYAALAAREVADMLLAAIVAAGIPHPSLVVLTGRGVQMTWACDGAKASAWKRVRAVYDALHGPVLASNGTPIGRRRHKDDADLVAFEARMLPLWQLFKDCGLDRCVRDAARVVRLVGSINPKSGTMAALHHPSSIRDISRFAFHALADAILPLSRAEIQERREARAAAKGETAANDNGAPRKARVLPASYWSTVLADLHRLREHRGSMQVGYRGRWLFLTANATAHVHGGCLADWAADLAALAGLSEREARSALSTLGRRQQRHEAGERDVFEGKDWSPLYSFGAAKMVDWLDVMTEEADAAGLRQLVPGGAVSLTAAERQAAKRLRDGSTPRSATVDERVSDGLLGLALRADGWAMAEIAVATGRGETSLRAAMREAEAYQVSVTTDSVALADATSSATSLSNPHGSSRYIVDTVQCVTPAPARARTDAPILPSMPVGAVRIRRWTPGHATVETATGMWSWTSWRSEWPCALENRLWDLEPGYAPTDADRALAEAAMAELEVERSSLRRVRTVAKARRHSTARPAAPQARPVVQRVTGDARWDNAYWRASQVSAITARSQAEVDPRRCVTGP